MWGNTLIIDTQRDPSTPDELQAKEEDKLVLTWEERRWLRGRFTTARGRKIGIALPTGTKLSPGTILHVEEEWYLRIEAAAEAILEIFPTAYAEAVKIAFEIGNRHFPLALKGNSILVPDDKAMVRLMERMGARVERRREIFDPIGNAQPHPHG